MLPNPSNGLLTLLRNFVIATAIPPIDAALRKSKTPLKSALPSLSVSVDIMVPKASIIPLAMVFITFQIAFITLRNLHFSKASPSKSNAVVTPSFMDVAPFTTSCILVWIRSRKALKVSTPLKSYFSEIFLPKSATA